MRTRAPVHWRQQSAHASAATATKALSSSMTLLRSPSTWNTIPAEVRIFSLEQHALPLPMQILPSTEWESPFPFAGIILFVGWEQKWIKLQIRSGKLIKFRRVRPTGMLPSVSWTVMVITLVVQWFIAVLQGTENRCMDSFDFDSIYTLLLFDSFKTDKWHLVLF